ncbi:hypothetical protein Goarm_009723 [Gossypium armourianum]|uniref:Reverse transcriptase n=1 Tax=Gossypium armourianum TaxID=34283 RepID=A0A7J9JTT1_9ROSI|nr:hypothetical protein [Gossypium armourianum]
MVHMGAWTVCVYKYKRTQDRGVATLSWVNRFSGYQIEHLSHSFSDHCPLFLDSEGIIRRKEDRNVNIFRFEAKWCLDDSFEALVKKWWNENDGNVLGKLEKLGDQILRWKKSSSRTEKKKRLDLEDRLSILEVIHKLFDDETVKRILFIPISVSRPKDVRVWKYEGLGEYTVKSGYRALSTVLLQNRANLSSIPENYKKFFTGLWILSIPGKIKIHVWRLFHDLVPHYENLARQTLCEAVVCPLCKTESENSDHLLWSCDILNKLVHEGVKFSRQEVLGFIRGFEQELNISRENISLGTGLDGKVSWRPPNDGFVKINFDASFLQDLSLAVTAVMVRNHKGEIVGTETYLLNDVADPFVAEARACERALIFSHTLGLQRLVVEGDALLVIKSIRNREVGKSIIRSIVYHIQQLDRSFEEVTYTFVPREGYEAAHALAIEGRRRGAYRIWDTDVPNLVLKAVRKDWIAWLLWGALWLIWDEEEPLLMFVWRFIF